MRKKSKCQTGLINARSGIKTERLSQTPPHGEPVLVLQHHLVKPHQLRRHQWYQYFPSLFYPSGTRQGFNLSDLQRLKGPSHFKLDMYGGLNSLNLCLDAARSSFHKICLFKPIISQKDTSASALTRMHRCNCSHNSQNRFSVSKTTGSCSNAKWSAMTFRVNGAWLLYQWLMFLFAFPVSGRRLTHVFHFHWSCSDGSLQTWFAFPRGSALTQSGLASQSETSKDHKHVAK